MTTSVSEPKGRRIHTRAGYARWHVNLSCEETGEGPVAWRRKVSFTPENWNACCRRSVDRTLKNQHLCLEFLRVIFLEVDSCSWANSKTRVDLGAELRKARKAERTCSASALFVGIVLLSQRLEHGIHDGEFACDRLWIAGQILKPKGAQHRSDIGGFDRSRRPNARARDRDADENR